jgi:hypothetical protein
MLSLIASNTRILTNILWNYDILFIFYFTLDGINLKINLTKSKIYLSKYETIDEITRIKSAYRSIGVEDCNIFTHPENMILLDSPDSRDTFGLVVLAIGTPVGTEEFIK